MFLFVCLAGAEITLYRCIVVIYVTNDRSWRHHSLAMMSAMRHERARFTQQTEKITRVWITFTPKPSIFLVAKLATRQVWAAGLSLWDGLQYCQELKTDIGNVGRSRGVNPLCRMRATGKMECDLSDSLSDWISSCFSVDLLFINLCLASKIIGRKIDRTVFWQTHQWPSVKIQVSVLWLKMLTQKDRLNGTERAREKESK